MPFEPSEKGQPKATQSTPRPFKAPSRQADGTCQRPTKPVRAAEDLRRGHHFQQIVLHEVVHLGVSWVKEAFLADSVRRKKLRSGPSSGPDVKKKVSVWLWAGP